MEFNNFRHLYKRSSYTVVIQVSKLLFKIFFKKKRFQIPVYPKFGQYPFLKQSFWLISTERGHRKEEVVPVCILPFVAADWPRVGLPPLWR